MHQKYYLVSYQINNIGQLLNISPHIFTMMNTVNKEFFSVEVWFTDQSSKAL